MNRSLDKAESAEQPAEGLTRKTMRGIFWSGTSQFMIQGISFFVNIVLARLLFPEDFGILAMAALFIEMTGLISDFGLSAALIQRKKINQTQRSTAFWMNILVGVTLVGLSVLCAPLAADFFRRDIIAPVIMVSSIGFVIRAVGGVHRALMTRQLRFKTLAIPDVVGILAFSASVIPMVLMGLGLWSIVLANLVSALISSTILWRLSSWRPSFLFDWAACRDLMSFGLNVLGEQVLDYVNVNVDYLIISRLLGEAMLGIYTFAFNLMTAPLRKIAQMVTRVTFPAFSQVQTDNAVLRAGYLKSVRYISLITFPILTGLGVLADDFIRLVYGNKWIAAIVPLQIMCLDGLIRTISTTTGSILYAKNRADIGFKWKIVTVCVVYIGAQYGIIGVSIAVALATLVLAPIIQVITHRLMDLRFSPFGAALAPAAVSSIMMVGWLFILMALRRQYWPDGGYLFLGTAVMSGALIYTVGFRLIFKDRFMEAIDLVKQLRG